jgi:hypothetical protein
VARGRYKAGRSDITVVVLLHEATPALLDALAGPLRAAWRAARVEPMLMTPAEVTRAADAFATKFQDIQSCRIVLAGVDPFAELAITTEDLRLRVEQELRNLSLRLRRRYVSIHDSPVEMTALLQRTARPLALALKMLLRLHGKALPEEDRTGAIFAAAADAFALDGKALARLAALREEMHLEGEDVQRLFVGALDSATRAADIADGQENAP